MTWHLVLIQSPFNEHLITISSFHYFDGDPSSLLSPSTSGSLPRSVYNSFSVCGLVALLLTSVSSAMTTLSSVNRNSTWSPNFCPISSRGSPFVCKVSLG